MTASPDRARTCRGYGFPAVGEVIGGGSFAALQGGGMGKSLTKDAALVLPGQVGQSRIALGPRSSMVPWQKLILGRRA
jgi:hypothetical protein